MDCWIFATFDRDYIKTHRLHRESTVLRDIHGGRSNDFSLFMMIDRVARRRERSRCAIPYFDKCQAIDVKHDEVDLATSAVKISHDGDQTQFDEIVERQLLCLTTYNSCTGEFHGASSATSGTIKDPSLLISWIGPPASSCPGNATASPR